MPIDNVTSFVQIHPLVAMPLENAGGEQRYALLQPSDDLEVIYETDIENVVNVEYVKINGNFDYGRGLIYLCGEADDSSAFYTVKDGRLDMLKTNEASLTYTWKGTVYDIEFSWCGEDDSIYVYSTGKEPASDAFWYVTPVNGRTDVVALTLSFGRQDNYSE